MSLFRKHQQIAVIQPPSDVPKEPDPLPRRWVEMDGGWMRYGSHIRIACGTLTVIISDNFGGNGPARVEVFHGNIPVFSLEDRFLPSVPTEGDAA